MGFSHFEGVPQPQVLGTYDHHGLTTSEPWDDRPVQAAVDTFQSRIFLKCLLKGGILGIVSYKGIFWVSIIYSTYKVGPYRFLHAVMGPL